MPGTLRLTFGEGITTIVPTGLELTSELGAPTVVRSPSALQFVTQPAGAVDGVAFTTQPSVRLIDSTGAAVSQAGRVVTLAILTGTGTLIGTATATTNASGVATWTNVGIDASAPPSAFTLRASAAGLAVADSGSVTVSAGAALWALDPVALGLSPLLETEFNGGTIGTGIPAADGLEYYGDGSFVQNAAASEQTPPNVFRTSYPGNSAGNGAGGAMIVANITGQRRFYLRLRAYFSPGYVVHSNNGTEKFFYPRGAGGASDPSIGICYPETGAGSGPSGTRIGIGIIPQTVQGDGNFRPAESSPVWMGKGVINAVELFLQMNTAGQANGVFRAYINGVLHHERTTLQYTTDAAGVWNIFRMDGTRGGGASSVLTPPGGQTRDYDYMAVWGATTRGT